MSDTVTLTFDHTIPVDVGEFGVLELTTQIEKELSDTELHGLICELHESDRSQLIKDLVFDYLTDTKQVELAATILGVDVSDIT